jgi:hypothetical protein
MLTLLVSLAGGGLAASLVTAPAVNLGDQIPYSGMGSVYLKRMASGAIIFGVGLIGAGLITMIGHAVSPSKIHKS